ncbi:hypothetical protein I2W78_13410 [Streptomyces spinoverrucosus]|uniref:DUF6571 family protein n=1 Tax=Streptomyces spinoverrucosus TaxID=284043 RepID=UPI0018C445A6|nr:DUF6571 family protein [Streptomyces spinoverrucosus]MBG0852810.1 hypothetical protein [Streptomyces spinoverrucosus]
MAFTYMDLVEVDLGKLGTAVSDWGKSVDALKTAAENARTGMRAKSDKARWAGVNATVTREFVAKTAEEISDLHTEADSIHKVLVDGHAELVSLQKKIRTAIEQDATKLGVRVEDIGEGKVRCFFPHIRGDSDDRTQEQLDAKQELEDRINRLVAHAAEIDASLARALAKSHGGNKHNAGHKSYESLDDAQAERAAELAKRGPEMSDKQYMELNSILRFNARDADFSTDFYKSLGGPKEALEFYGRMSLDGTMGDNKERLALARQLQRNMGMALASATDPDSKSHLPASWASDFRKLGAQRVELYPGAGQSPYGYQLLGGILRYGNYDARFLNPIAEHVVQLHKKDPYRFMDNKPTTGGADLDWGFNPSGRTGAGYDPLTGVLEALGHSPEAAKKFFSDPPTVYKEDGTVDENATLDFDSYFDELTKNDFEWAPDSLVHAGSDEAKHVREGGPDALGHALEAATTGAAWDADPPELHRDEQAWKIMEKVILRYNVTVEDGPPDVMKDSLARMGAAYIDDLNYSIKDFGGSGDEVDRDRLFANSSDGWPRESFGEYEARNFMMLVAADEDGYKTLSTAHQVYTGSGLAALEGNRADGLSFAQNAAKVSGILDESRAHQIREDFGDDKSARDLEMAKQGEWRKTLMSGALTAAAAGGTALVLGPAAGLVAATAVPVLLGSGASALSTAYGNHTMEYLQDNEYKNGARALEEVQGLEAVGERGAWVPVSNYADAVGMTVREKDALTPVIEGSYRDGKDAVSDAWKAFS